MNEPTIDEGELLRRGISGDRPAIDALVRRYANLVYGVALRQTGGDAQMAADVSQGVFLVFMKKIGSIRGGSALPGWFHTTTRFAVRAARRSARRREHYELRAAKGEQVMNSAIDEQAGLELVDEAIGSLSRTDGNLILSRYFQNREVSAIAADIGISEQTARKRITRAIERLRRFFASRGAAMTVGGVTGLLGSAGSHIAPAAVVEGAAAVAVSGAAMSASSLSIAQITANAMLWVKVKLAAAVVALAIVTAGGATMLQVQQAARPAPPPASAPAQEVVTAPALRAEEAMVELNLQYALANTEILRLIRAPFSPARTAWAVAEYPEARGAERIRSLGFSWENGKLDTGYMSYSDLRLDSLLALGLRIAWFRVDGLNMVNWQPISADIVVRDSATPEQKLDALEKVIKDVTGESVRFRKTTQLRLCIILVRSRVGRGVVDGYDTDRFARALDAPTIRAGDDFDNPMFVYRHGERFYPPNVTLDRADADYEKRLREVVAQIQEQNGGEWRVEWRDLEIFVLEHVR